MLVPASPIPKGPPCTVCVLLELLPKADRERLQDMLANAKHGTQYVEIEKYVRDHGWADIDAKTYGRHVNRGHTGLKRPLVATLTPADPRILTVDIETAPATVYTFGLRDQNIGINQVIKPTRTLCFAAKWLDSKRIEFYREHGDERESMIRESWRLYDEADIVITYNGRSFDNKHLAREWLEAGLGPPSPWQDIDLLTVARGRFRFLSNKLAHVTDALGLPTKIDTGGMALWTAVLDGDAKAWREFERYNKQDVIITEQLYRLLLPWIKGPHRGMFGGGMASCHLCGSSELTFAGFTYTKTVPYPRLRCECGAWNKVLRNGQTRAA